MFRINDLTVVIFEYTADTVEQAQMGKAGDQQMIDQFQIQLFKIVFQNSGTFKVSLRRIASAAGMIVRDDHAGSVILQHTAGNILGIEADLASGTGQKFTS